MFRMYKSGQDWANYAETYLSTNSKTLVYSARELLMRCNFSTLNTASVWNSGGELEQVNIKFWEYRDDGYTKLAFMDDSYPWYKLVMGDDREGFLRGVKMARFWGDYMSYFLMEGIISYMEKHPEL